MKLDEFIREAIVEIMKGIEASDRELKNSKVGSIYKGTYDRTMAQTLATLRLVKGSGNEAVLVVGFDVAVTVEEKGEASDKVTGGVGAILSVVGVKVGAETASRDTQTSSNTHRITFSVPLSFQP
jgi:hypothetical protein